MITLHGKTRNVARSSKDAKHGLEILISEHTHWRGRLFLLQAMHRHRLVFCNLPTVDCGLGIGLHDLFMPCAMMCCCSDGALLLSKHVVLLFCAQAVFSNFPLAFEIVLVHFCCAYMMSILVESQSDKSRLPHNFAWMGRALESKCIPNCLFCLKKHKRPFRMDGTT